MIAWDIDGIFTSDLVYEEDKIDHLLHFRHNNILPIFEPSGDFYLITGRPKSDEPHTLNWINTHWKNKPLKVFHDNPDMKRASDYKLKILLENPEIDVFVESNPYQCSLIERGLRKNSRHVKVIHFAEMVRLLIDNLHGPRYEVLP